MNNNVRKVTSENYPTDSGREGELIFRLVYQQAGCKKPVSRLWLSSMEENAIREGFAHLKPSTEYDALYNAALCRERADWMVGINASRLFSCLYGQPLAVGRVMTPVLAMTVVREAAIAAFVPEKFYTVALTLADGGTASSKRFAQKADAELLLSKCRKEGRVTVQKMERKEKSESPPQLYDLTALQRDANRLLGFTAQQTLDYAQSLYEKRLITYPRTDSRFLTEDMAASLPGLVTDTGRAFAVEEPIPIHVQQVINGGKVTDHHALLPTKSMANADLAALPAGERNVLRLIAARLLCAVGEPHCYAETTLTTICAGEEFSAKGKLVLSDGWRAMERKMLGELLGKQKEPAVLPDVQEQSQCSVTSADLKEGQTSPPKHFTEDLLLHAMETDSADSMPDGVERQGIGTRATRAATIEKLVQTLPFQKEIQLLFHQRKAPEPHRLVDGGQAVAAGKGTAAAALIINDPVFKACHILIIKWDLIHRKEALGTVFTDLSGAVPVGDPQDPLQAGQEPVLWILCHQTVLRCQVRFRHLGEGQLPLSAHDPTDLRLLGKDPAAVIGHLRPA